MLTRSFFAFAAAVTLTLIGAETARADDVPSPNGDVILTVSGDIATTNVGDTLQFDRATLTDLGLTTIETTTIWTDGTQVFEGIPLATLVDLLGIEDGTLNATALNDYTVEIPVSDAVEGGPIIALLLNGEEMSVRDKGPLWVVYPYDASDAYQTEVIYSRSIWQLDRIEVVE
ncbi:oxidoreductase [Pseudooctadecabacter jejudonensis]|uniref:Oxidoreductase molybdopterin binding domain protein n=1 Tax=Pseudooctadecabacter jejudonensis TaxID=1391910 RepID=A0A1Y5RYX7_9RHOB|nr:oxidoreductase [Pseudooctadecabacter jejudonensis]SLN27353.1 Oxidoreductase molybdopterin binding domain protein [Pseudooctadecabacter jejudonensis]